jgi:multidrug resistance efflux pump
MRTDSRVTGGDSVREAGEDLAIKDTSLFIKSCRAAKQRVEKATEECDKAREKLRKAQARLAAEKEQLRKSHEKLES